METKTKKAEETKMRIVKSAQKLFHKKGFEATSIREIVEAAGCAKGTFYLYFETKLHLLIYISNELLKTFNEIIAKELSTISDNPFSQVENVFNSLYTLMKDQEGSLRMFHTREFLDLIIEQGVNASFISSITAQLSIFLKAGIEKGYFREVDPHLYSKMIFSLIHDTMESALLTKFPADTELVKNELMIMLKKIIEK